MFLTLFASIFDESLLVFFDFGRAMAISETSTTHSFQSLQNIFKFVKPIDSLFNALYNDTLFITVAQYLQIQSYLRLKLYLYWLRF